MNIFSSSGPPTTRNQHLLLPSSPAIGNQNFLLLSSPNHQKSTFGPAQFPQPAGINMFPFPAPPAPQPSPYACNLNQMIPASTSVSGTINDRGHTTGERPQQRCRSVACSLGRRNRWWRNQFFRNMTPVTAERILI